jgi:uncharacterized protein
MNRVEDREAVTFESGGVKLFGVMHRPLTKGKHPAVVFFHGYAGNKSGRNRLYVKLAQQLAQMGFVVLRFDFRGSGDSEGDFQEITIDGEVADALNALKYLSEDKQVDTSRIGILGRSLGGAIALLAAQKHGHIKSINLWAPLFHTLEWRKKWLEKPSLDQVPPELRINGQLPNMQFIEQFFHIDMSTPLKELESTPLLHIHGEKDTIVKIQHADLYADARKNCDGKTLFIRLQESDHDFSNLSEQILAINETCKWFSETLK